MNEIKTKQEYAQGPGAGRASRTRWLFIWYMLVLPTPTDSWKLFPLPLEVSLKYDRNEIFPFLFHRIINQLLTQARHLLLQGCHSGILRPPPLHLFIKRRLFFKHLALS